MLNMFQTTNMMDNGSSSRVQPPPAAPEPVAVAVTPAVVNNVTECAVANIPSAPSNHRTSHDVVEDAVANIPGMDVVEEAVANIPLDFPSQQSQKQTSFFAILRDKFRLVAHFCETFLHDVNYS